MANCTECKEKRAEEAVREMNGGHSNEWSLSQELIKSNKRMFILNIVLAVLLLLTIVLSVYERMQYDYSSYEVSTDGGGSAYFNDQGDYGVAYNGTDSSEEKNEEGQVNGQR